jgi:hypothetical protein
MIRFAKIEPADFPMPEWNIDAEQYPIAQEVAHAIDLKLTAFAKIGYWGGATPDGSYEKEMLQADYIGAVLVAKRMAMALDVEYKTKEDVNLTLTHTVSKPATQWDTTSTNPSSLDVATAEDAKKSPTATNYSESSTEETTDTRIGNSGEGVKPQDYIIAEMNLGKKINEIYAAFWREIQNNFSQVFDGGRITK